MRKKILPLVVLLTFIHAGIKSQNSNALKHVTPPAKNTVTTVESEEFETILSAWYNALDNMQITIGSSDADYNTFRRFDKDTIENETGRFFTLAKSGSINSSNVSSYINAKMEEFAALYEKFAAIAREFPSSIDEFAHPFIPPANICNPGCSNIGFEDGNLSGWYAYYGVNSSNTSRNITGITGGAAGAVQKAALDPNTGLHGGISSYQVHITSGTRTDWFLDNFSSYTMSQVSPYGGNYSCMIGDSINNGRAVALLEQTFQVDTSNPNLTIQFSLFMELPTHNYYQQPFFNVFFLDASGDTVLNCGKYQIIAPNPTNAYQSLHPLGFVGIYYRSNSDTIYWKDWTTINVNLTPFIGQCLTVGYEVADCELGQHCAWAYVDASCTPNNIISSSPAFCGQDSIILTAPPGFIGYKWYGGPTGGIHGSDSDQSVQIDSVGNYCVIATPITGVHCADTICIYIPRVTGTPPHPSFTVNQSGCTGQEVCFTNTSTPDSAQGAKFSWDFYNIGLYDDTLVNPCWVYNSSGTYTIKLHEDYNGCGADTFVTITVSPVNASAVVNNNSGACINSGSATVSPCGGKLPYTYSWSPSGGNLATATGLGAGTYTVTVKDNAGIVSTAAVTITSPGSLTAGASLVSNATACGNNGVASVTVGGGTIPYTYSWSPGSNTSSTATGLSGGTYTVAVTDNSGCTATSSVTITQPPPTTLGITINLVNDIPCFGGNGNAIANAGTGGVAPYTYSWSPGGGTNLSTIPVGEGTYTVTVTDNIGCTATASATITQPANALGITMLSVTNILCFGGTGNATANAATGGTIPYTYLWSPGGGTNLTTTAISAGTYTITVTDNNGCPARATAIITQPASALGITISSVSNVSCNGGTGNAAASPGSGGNPPYTYSWSSSGGTNLTLTGVLAGTYTITVSDNNLCTATAGVTITEPPILSAYAIVNNNSASCTINGSVTASTSGGTSPYTYSWTNGETDANATGLSAGTYSVTITDNNGCTTTASATITAPPSVSASAIVNTNATGCVSNGSAMVSASGGTSPYTYSWAGGNTDANATGLSAGSFTVTVTDNSGCTATASVTITAPAGITANAVVNNNATGCAANGIATASASGGTSPYTYSWTNGEIVANATGLSAGAYTVTVKDNSGCSGTTSVTITSPASITADATVNNNATGCAANGSATASASGGTSPYTYSWTNGEIVANATGLSAGTYTVTVTDNSGCSGTANVTITAPSSITAHVTVNNNATGCAANGSATASASGGISPYTYSWTNGEIVANATGLSAGTYTVTVQDNSGCSGTASVTITAPSNITAHAIVNNNATGCAANGSATASASGGTSPYTYSWTNGEIVANATGLSAGAYTVTVTDNSGCSGTANVTITAPSSITAHVTVNNNATGCAANGSATASASGGTSPYTYSWTNGEIVANATGLSAGTYTVTVKDNSGCSGTASVTITAPSNITAHAIVNNNATGCAANGSATASASGGTSPYTYSWTNGEIVANATGLSAGTYTVTVKDNSGCSGTASVTITAPSNITAHAIVNNNATGCAANGSATASTSGGTSPYTYSWTNGEIVANATGLSAGTYTVTVKDNSGCSGTASVTITAPSNITAHAIVNNNATGCAANGSATASTSGGTSPYTYSWTNGEIVANATGLSAGTYTVTVKDNSGCSGTASVTITAPSNITAHAIVNNNATGCAANGSATASTSGGTSPYTYSWTNGEIVANATGLSAGTYTVTVKDNSGCSGTASVTITAPSNITAHAIVNNNATGCAANGSATASTSGGTSPYTYSWTNGEIVANATGLSAGTYTVTVKDNSGCSGTASVTITAPSNITAHAIVNNNATGCAANGSATASASGGTSPYTYSWTNGEIVANATGLSAGTYTVTVKDNSGCSGTASVTITAPSNITAHAIVNNNATGCAANGSATASASGGTSPYTYSWTNGEIVANATGLSAGTYTVTVKDNSGCSGTASVTITAPSNITAHAIVNNNATGCAANGSATASTSGGTSPYTYSWTNGEIVANATGLSAGTYTVTVKDNSGCSGTASVTITAPSNITAHAIVNNNATGCAANGSATASASGGTSPYTYSWTNGEIVANATGLSAGTYTVTVKDNSGCSGTASVTITAPSNITAHAIVNNNATGCAANGSATASASGGTSPYTYSWTNGEIVANATGLSAGTYTVTVKDNSGCSGTASVTITAPSNITAHAIVNNNATGCAANGSATASASGGTSPYTYSWTNGETVANATGLSAGTYTVTVKDNSGCSGTASVTITAPSNITAHAIVNNNATGCAANGSATASASGGTSPYTYSWTNGETIANATALSGGTYTVTVIDHSGCMATASITITAPTNIAVLTVVNNNATSCAAIGNATASASGGTSPYTYSWTNGNRTANATGLSAGIYIVTVTDHNGCIATASVSITQPPGLTITTVIQDNVSCNGGTNGIAKAGASGATSPYTYSWRPGGSTTYIASNLSAGTYTITIKDNTGCTATADAIITQPNAIRDSLSFINNPACNGATGSAGVGVKDGTPPYTFTWSPSVTTTATATGLGARNYVVTIKDSNGCTAVLSFDITQPLALRDSMVSAVTVNVLCNGSSTGKATVGVKYGTAPYTYSWSPNVNSTATASGISAGTYTITVRDHCGNSASTSVIITQPGAMIIRTDSVSQSSTPCNGTASVTILRGGTPPYTYSWTTGRQTTSTITGQCGGTYCCVITDSHGCTETACVTILRTVGIETIDNSTSLVIYPNPNSGQFTISGLSKGMNVDIYDCIGRRIRSIEASDEKTIQINIATEANGIYLIRITDKEGILVTDKKVIKME